MRVPLSNQNAVVDNFWRQIEPMMVSLSTTTLQQSETSLVLVVDSSTMMRSLLRKAMENEGYEVIEATNSEEALAAYLALQPDLVLLDAVMPQMDGLTCCQHLQRLPGGDRTPILMITAAEDENLVTQVFDVGAADFIAKPINWTVLRQRVRRWLHQVKLYKQLETANQQLQRLACIDSLTQVANRHRFDQVLEQEIWQMERDQVPLSLILCDVDYFKLYNDTYGHQQGDRCLQEIASALQTAAQRPKDLVARYGGEEFAIILPHTNATGAVRVAQKIREQIKAAQIEHSASPISPYVTLSLGIACAMPGEIVTASRLIRAADLGLYRAKHQGRDRLAL